uniref:Uncharacterized protein n=1 Tax=Romanomermis culicivorax TaxID=13658 RepID=A0A915HKF0_ROMCU
MPLPGTETGSKSTTESTPYSGKSPKAGVSAQKNQGSEITGYSFSSGSSARTEADNSHNSTAAQPRQSSSSSTSSSTNTDDPLFHRAYEKQRTHVVEQTLPPTEICGDNDVAGDYRMTLHTLTMSGEEFDVKSKKPASKLCSTNFKSKVMSSIFIVYKCESSRWKGLRCFKAAREKIQRINYKSQFSAKYLLLTNKKRDE